MDSTGTDWIGVAEAAKLLGVSEQTVRNWVDAGSLQSRRVPHGSLTKRLIARSAAIEKSRDTGGSPQVDQASEPPSSYTSNDVRPPPEEDDELAAWSLSGNREDHALGRFDLPRQGRLLDSIMERLASGPPPGHLEGALIADVAELLDIPLPRTNAVLRQLRTGESEA